MPFCRPSVPIIAPPMSGEITIGIRFSIDCTVKPIARRSFGSASPIVANMAGDPMACHAMTNASPRKRQGHAGLER